MCVNTWITGSSGQVHIKCCLALLTVNTQQAKCVTHSMPSTVIAKLYNKQRTNNKGIQDVILRCEIKGKNQHKMSCEELWRLKWQTCPRHMRVQYINPILGRRSGLKGNKYLHRFCAILGSSTLSSLILFFMDFLSSRSSSSFLTDEDRNTKLFPTDKRKLYTNACSCCIADVYNTQIQIQRDYEIYIFCQCLSTT